MIKAAEGLTDSPLLRKAPVRFSLFDCYRLLLTNVAFGDILLSWFDSKKNTDIIGRII